ncbi:hypothetical protein A8U91_00485 [Halomonas elongata]|uniref:Uncharacterized protein n=1 Tax=Halomonas elongata TaxID=2746 RepID=A0A1B8P1P1_HALEL|nr:hypothetical protein A8U91_00485 [Halomonas elongata]
MAEAYFDIGEKYIRTKNRLVWYTFAGLRHSLDSIKSRCASFWLGPMRRRMSVRSLGRSCSGPEWIGSYEVLEYPRLSFGQMDLRNVETGTEYRIGYAQTKLA